jgi:hypothetical protein
MCFDLIDYEEYRYIHGLRNGAIVQTWTFEEIVEDDQDFDEDKTYLMQWHIKWLIKKGNIIVKLRRQSSRWMELFNSDIQRQTLTVGWV